MWLHGRILLVPLLLATAVGCASRRGVAPQQSPAVVVSPVTRAADPKAEMPLEQIEPKVAGLPAPSTQPGEAAPLKSVELFAQARAAMNDGRRFRAINLLKEAVAIDPYSSAVRQALAEAQLGNATFNDESIATLEKAAALTPDSLDVQMELGRQYWRKNELDKALLTFRRALLTADYGDDDDRSALVDYFLAETLQQLGYDRAALSRYQSMLTRLQSPGPDLRGNPAVNYFVQHPEKIWEKIAFLSERSGHYTEALAAYEEAAKRDPDEFDLQVHIVEMLNELHSPLARERAKQVVKVFDARADAVALLCETHRLAGNEAGAVDVLKQLYSEDPSDRLVFYALADLLQQIGRRHEARELLSGQLKQRKYDIELIDRLRRLYELDGDWQGAARLLIEASAARPDMVSRLTSQWTRLIRPTARRRIRLQDIAAIAVPADQEGAKQFWIATLANATSRAPLARSATEASLAAKPAYAPAYRVVLADALMSDDSAAVKSLLERAASSPALAAELQGLVQARAKHPDQAEAAFRRAAELGAKSPDLQDELADALVAQNKDTEAEKALWQIIADWPDYEPAYLQLVGFYNGRQREDQLIRTLDTWLTNDASSVTARILQAQYLISARRPEAADSVLSVLVNEKPDDGDVLMQVGALYAQQGKLDVFAVKLADLYARQPDNRDVLERLVDTQLDLKPPRRNEATRLVDEARKHFANDADALYFVSGLYQRLEQKDIAEDVLQQALKVDPKHPGANNDLGYNWVDAGRNVDQAEKLVRTAVDGEPDNQAFLDSLGWVLYKRSNFAESVKYLQAASDGPRPDPIVLDHLADALYRAGDLAKARQTWETASKRLEKSASQREDLRKLKLELTNKLKQARAGDPVTVAPVIDPPPAKAATDTRGARYGSTQEKSNGRP